MSVEIAWKLKRTKQCTWLQYVSKGTDLEGGSGELNYHYATILVHPSSLNKGNYDRDSV